MGRLIAFVGTYGVAPEANGGGIYTIEVSHDGGDLKRSGHCPEPVDAGYLVVAKDRQTLYAVDERKTDGRGPVSKPAAVHALKIDTATGALVWRNCVEAPGPRPTYLDILPGRDLLFSANHGDFQHVEKVVRNADGFWSTTYVYDDSTVVAFKIAEDGDIKGVANVRVFEGQGLDPNNSPQNGGHAQSSAHAHCAVVDPSGKYLLVCDKGTDCIQVLHADEALTPVNRLQFESMTGPRHLAFDPGTGIAYATLEFASEIVSLAFDADTGKLTVLDRLSTLSGPCDRCNEPAEVRVHPSSGIVYVNNRGEDSLSWFSSTEEGQLQLRGSVPLATSIHPGLAARSFTFTPDGEVLLVADRPANLVRSYQVCSTSGALSPIAEITVPDPAYIAFVELDDAGGLL